MPGATVELNSTDTPASTPAETGLDNSRARVTHSTPSSEAIIAGHDPNPVLTAWNPGKSQCVLAANATNENNTTHETGDTLTPTARASERTTNGNNTNNATVTAANWPCNGSVNRNHNNPNGG